MILLILAIVAAVLAVTLISISVYRGPTLDESAPECPNPPPPPRRPEPKEPSCFIKGVCRSLVEEPEMWAEVEESVYANIGYRWRRMFYAQHKTHKVVINMYQVYNAPPEICILVNDAALLGPDYDLVKSTLESHPIGQMKRRIEAAKAEEARRAATQEHFTKLGCP